MACAMPSASTPCVPGFTGTHSSALAPVVVILDSTWTSDPRMPGGPAGTHVTVSHALRDGRVPGPEEIGTERNDEPRVLEIECRQLRLTEAQRVRLTQHGVVEQFERDGWRGAELRQPRVDEHLTIAEQSAGNELDRLLSTDDVAT